MRKFGTEFSVICIAMIENYLHPDMQTSDAYATAMRLLDKGCATDALIIGENLVSAHDEASRLAGFLCMAFVYETGGDNFAIDLNRAIACFRQAAVMAPDALSFNNLARVSMKRRSQSGFEDAYRYLQEAAQFGWSAEVLLGFAEYYKSKPDPDLAKAKKFYAKAARLGRFAGFFGCSEVARLQGRTYQAFAVDVLRLFLGPIIALIMGRRAQQHF